MNADPVTFGIFETIVVSGCFRRNKSLSETRFLHQLDLKTSRGDHIDSEASGFGLGVGALQNPLAGAAVKRWLDVGILLLEGIDQGDDLIVVQRAVEYDLAFGFG